MASKPLSASSAAKRRFAAIQKTCPVRCNYLQQSVTSLADYFAAIGGIISGVETFWFRGQSDASFRPSLTPAALRHSTVEKRQAALDLISDFKRIAEAKLPRVPDPKDEFKWAQIAQHFGLPTRLLDWTESATTALFFACLKPSRDGIVFLMNPVELNRLTDISLARILDPQTDQQKILRFLTAGASEGKRKSYPIAVNPVWSSERIIVQRGTFTLHGPMFSLDNASVPSLVALPIFWEAKARLRSELRRVGVDEMTLFPELEHSCTHLKMCKGLMDFD